MVSGATFMNRKIHEKYLENIFVVTVIPLRNCAYKIILRKKQAPTPKEGEGDS